MSKMVKFSERNEKESIKRRPQLFRTAIAARDKSFKVRASCEADKFSYKARLVLEVQEIRRLSGAAKNDLQSGTFSLLSKNVFGDKWFMNSLITGDSFSGSVFAKNGY